MEGRTQTSKTSHAFLEADPETGQPLRFHAHPLRMLVFETGPELLPGWHGGRSRTPMSAVFQCGRAVLALSVSFFADAGFSAALAANAGRQSS
jgi:hypothetical protein